jgi:hypothetical protein
MFYNIGPLNIISIQILSSQNKRRKKLELPFKDRKFYGPGAVFTKLFFISTNELNKLDRLQEDPEEASFIPSELFIILLEKIMKAKLKAFVQLLVI